MFCTNCGNKLADDAAFCTGCGNKITKDEETPVEVQAEAVATEAPVEEAPAVEAQAEPVKEETPITVNVNTYSEPIQQEMPRAVNNSHTTYNDGYIKTAPALQLPAGRGLLKWIFYGLITFGIYNLVAIVKISEEINIAASRYDGQRTMHYLFVLLLSPLTLGIYPIVWMHKLCNRLGREVNRRGYNMKFGGATMWLWGVLGSLIIIGPFVYIYKLMKANRLINTSYNYYG